MQARKFQTLLAYLAPLASTKTLSRCRPCPWTRASLATEPHCTRMKQVSQPARHAQTVSVVLWLLRMVRALACVLHMWHATTTKANVRHSCRHTPCSSKRSVPSMGSMAGRPRASVRCHARTVTIRVRNMRRSLASQTQGLFGRRIRAGRSLARSTRSVGLVRLQQWRARISVSRYAKIVHPVFTNLRHL